MLNFLHVITDAASSRRGKYVSMALWLLLAAALVGLAPKLASIYNTTATQDIPPDAPSQVAQRLLLQEFPNSRGTPAVLVFYDTRGLSNADLVQAKRVSDWLVSPKKPAAVGTVLSVFTVPQAKSQLVSKDRTTMTIIVPLAGDTSGSAFQHAVTDIRAYLNNVTAHTWLRAYATGPAGVVEDTVLIFSATDLPLLLGTVGLVLLFGAGTDYTIFVAARFREELLRTQDKHEAMRATMRAVGEAITSSAGTVILALLTLTLTAIGLYNSLGPALAVAVAVMLMAGLTLVPALLVWLGRAAYWPFVPRYQAEQAARSDVTSLRGFWGGLGAWTARHRVVAVAGSAVLLAVLALGNIGTQPSFNFLTSFRNPTGSSSGYAILR